jgi:hypothetical protein
MREKKNWERNSLYLMTPALRVILFAPFWFGPFNLIKGMLRMRITPQEQQQKSQKPPENPDHKDGPWRTAVVKESIHYNRRQSDAKNYVRQGPLSNCAL